MNEDQNKRVGLATLKFLNIDMDKDLPAATNALMQIITVQSERISELERKVEALSLPRHIG